jgi:hypothetical protein
MLFGRMVADLFQIFAANFPGVSALESCFMLAFLIDRPWRVLPSRVLSFSRPSSSILLSRSLSSPAVSLLYDLDFGSGAELYLAMSSSICLCAGVSDDCQRHDGCVFRGRERYGFFGLIRRRIWIWVLFS